MTDNEILRALECCVLRNTVHQRCHKCPCWGMNCMDKLVRNVNDLINRQKAENERLKAENAKLKHEMSYMTRPNTIGDTHEMGAW